MYTLKTKVFFSGLYSNITYNFDNKLQFPKMNKQERFI